MSVATGDLSPEMDFGTVNVANLVCFGSPLVDLTAPVDDAFLQKYGLEPDNRYAVDEKTRTIFEDIRSRIRTAQVGGSITNTVRTIRMLRGSPRNLTYFGTIGNDSYAELVKTQLDREGIGANLSVVGGNTGKVAVLLRGKARTLVTDLGVSRCFSLDDGICRAIDQADLIYISGFFISVSPETIARVIHKPVVFNLGASFLPREFPEQMKQLYRSASVVFGNEEEHRAFGRAHDITSENIKDVVEATNNNSSRVVVVTRGGGSVLVLQRDWLEFEVAPLDEDQVVDTNGAGDAFVGGFLSRYIEGGSIASCVECGIRIAREIVQSVGFNLASRIEDDYQ